MNGPDRLLPKLLPNATRHWVIKTDGERHCMQKSRQHRRSGAWLAPTNQRSNPIGFASARARDGPDRWRAEGSAIFQLAGSALGPLLK